MSNVLSLRSRLPSRVSRPRRSRDTGEATSTSLLKIRLSVCCLVAAALLALPSFAERQAYERYQTIVDRQMFGQPPDGFDPTKPPSEAKGGRDLQREQAELAKEQQKIKSAIRFSMINVTPDGQTAVGFTDSSDPKKPRNYYLKVGETRGGWSIKEADSIAGTMTIVKGDIEVSLSLGGDSAKGAGKTSLASASAAASAQTPANSIRARRAQRQAEREAQEARMAAMMKTIEDNKAAEAKRREDEARQREEDSKQREAERQAQRAQLQEIAEQLKRAREEKEQQQKAEQASEKTEDAS